jgi:hypothetical protein
MKPSDMPSLDDTAEAFRRPWNERLIEIHLPRGARRTAWGLQLYGPDGALLDERPTAVRVESIGLTMSVGHASEPALNVVSGDRKPPPTQPETDIAISATALLDAQRLLAPRQQRATADQGDPTDRQARRQRQPRAGRRRSELRVHQRRDQQPEHRGRQHGPAIGGLALTVGK